MSTNDYQYQYDPIGNRKQASLNAVTNFYAANQLNQYTNILEGGAPATLLFYDANGNITEYVDTNGTIAALRRQLLKASGSQRRMYRGGGGRSVPLRRVKSVNRGGFGHLSEVFTRITSFGVICAPRVTANFRRSPPGLYGFVPFRTFRCDWRWRRRVRAGRRGK
jgi:hypothetical protein